MTLNSLKNKIKKKPELSGLSDSIILEALEEYRKKNKISLDNLKQKDEKLIIAELRSQLRTLSGQFQKKSKDRKVLAKSKDWEEILKTHTSTSERLSFYPKLRDIIKSLKIKSILDLGCGINPLALSDLSKQYYASDIRQDELDIIDSFFSEKKISGKTFIFDLRKDPKNLPEADLTLIFKVLDIIEKNSHKISKNLIKSLKSKYILVSFPTKKLSGKRMNFPKRIWFENFLSKESWAFKKIKSINEVFYLISKY